MIRLAGVDPGLVHTGVVTMVFDEVVQELSIREAVFTGPAATPVALFLKDGAFGLQYDTWIEGFRTRGNLRVNKPMMDAIAHLKIELGPRAHVLDNMGAKQVVLPALMKAMEVWNFSTPSHHQDLRSAARILLFGALKLPEYNMILSEFIECHLDGYPWQILHL